MLFFGLLSLVSCSAFLSLKENREGHRPPGAASFTAHCPKESRAKHKGGGHCHSPQSPTTLKATFQSKTPAPLPDSGQGRGRVGAGHRGIPPRGGAVFRPRRLVGCGVSEEGGEDQLEQEETACCQGSNDSVFTTNTSMENGM